ncbi:MAG: alpha,alpha-trehalase TreF [Balneolales bacterium]|nr:alpha,alpha-trehalase TreF [Balneolales bacterium]
MCTETVAAFRTLPFMNFYDSINMKIQTEGPLFEAVQGNRIFEDSKFFVDAVPRKNGQLILEKYLSNKDRNDFDLKAFVEEHFNLPDHKAESEEEKEHQLLSHPDCESHIRALWPVLFRKARDGKLDAGSTLLALPQPYVVPGGRFREIYYWDSYFTALGLMESGHEDMVLNMTRNFASLISTFGHIPNGNRTYYLSRSQPPFFVFMAELCAEHFGKELKKEFLPALAKEYHFWTDKQGEPSRRFVSISLPDNKFYQLNRYWDDKPAPREESWFEDAELGEKIADTAEREKLYRNIRAACESGWDFTSRWLGDYKTLASIRTTDIIPADLNALLYKLEKTLAAWSLELQEDFPNLKPDFYEERAAIRLAAFNTLMWSPEEGFFFDYDLSNHQKTAVWSLAAVYPLFTGMANAEQAAGVAEGLKAKLLYDGGLASTSLETGQQWDFPNGWAPLQWLAVKGLQKYGHNELAAEIRDRWLRANDIIFGKSKKMVEKYNVADTSGNAGGGEYPLQDGFGWSNGVYLALSADKKSSFS